MASTDTPDDGDFASYIERQTQQMAAAAAQDHSALFSSPAESADVQGGTPGGVAQTAEDVFTYGEEPTSAFVEAFVELHAAPPLAEDELARQALAHPGGDGDPQTPE